MHKVKIIIDPPYSLDITGNGENKLGNALPIITEQFGEPDKMWNSYFFVGRVDFSASMTLSHDFNYPIMKK